MNQAGAESFGFVVRTTVARETASQDDVLLVLDGQNNRHRWRAVKVTERGYGKMKAGLWSASSNQVSIRVRKQAAAQSCGCGNSSEFVLALALLI